MIRRLKYHEIDFEKYSKCIAESINYLIYAEAWYLDIITDHNWNCIVYNDYEAVMPIPFIKKYGVNIVVQPILCQQLGIFFTRKINDDVFDGFVKIFNNKLVTSYHFNEENKFLKKNVAERTNQILNLNKDYSNLYNNYRRDRKRDISRIKNLNLQINSNINIDIFLSELEKKYSYLSHYYRKKAFKKLISEIVSRNHYTYYELLSEGEIVSSIFILNSKNRRILLLSSKSTEQHFKGSFAYLVNHFIEKNCDSNLILDFEGSMIPNIFDFNKSFGAEETGFSVINRSKTQMIKNFLIK